MKRYGCSPNQLTRNHVPYPELAPKNPCYQFIHQICHHRTYPQPYTWFITTGIYFAPEHIIFFSPAASLLHMDICATPSDLPSIVTKNKNCPTLNKSGIHMFYIGAIYNRRPGALTAAKDSKLLVLDCNVGLVITKDKALVRLHLPYMYIY